MDVGHVSHTAKLTWNLKNEGFPKGVFFFRVSICFFLVYCIIFGWRIPFDVKIFETQQRPSLAREYVPTWNRFFGSAAQSRGICVGFDHRAAAGCSSKSFALQVARVFLLRGFTVTQPVDMLIHVDSKNGIL